MFDEKDLLKTFQDSWSKNKYWVMAHSQQEYNRIRLLVKGNKWDWEKQQIYNEILDDLKEVNPTEKTLRVAYQHIWGYFKKVATIEEKNKYVELIESPLLNQNELTDFLKELSLKYDQEYLLKMNWF